MSNPKKGARALSLLTVVASSFVTSCALLSPSEPPADRWPATFVGTWETEGSGRYDREIWILSDGGELRVENVDDRDGQPPRTYSWNGSWWTKPTGDSGSAAREFCFVRSHARHAWCENYEVASDPDSGAATLIRLEERTLRSPRRS